LCWHRRWSARAERMLQARRVMSETLFRSLLVHGDRTAKAPGVFDATNGASLRYRDLRVAALLLAKSFQPGRHELAFLLPGRTMDSVVVYLALLAAGKAVALLDPRTAPES